MSWIEAISEIILDIWIYIYDGITMPFLFNFSIGQYLIVLLVIRLFILLLKTIRGDSKE